MKNYSIRSTQTKLSPRIVRHVQPRQAYQRPIPAHQHNVLASIQHLWLGDDRPIVLDSGCGRAASSVYLHRRFPAYQVLGLDQSLDRLQRSTLPMVAENIWGNPSDGLLVARMNVIDAWRLLREYCWPIAKHYLWYPNPWPKAKHAKRRFHAHPVFADCLALSPHLECRTQWELYAQEFCESVNQHTSNVAVMDRVPAGSACSHFEKKYHAHGVPLWRVLFQRG